MLNASALLMNKEYVSVYAQPKDLMFPYRSFKACRDVTDHICDIGLMLLRKHICEDENHHEIIITSLKLVTDE